MLNESEIRKRAIEILKKKKWIFWYPARIKYRQNDIFGIIDLLALRGKKLKYIQLTTLPNLARQRKKILNFFKEFKVKLPVEIWAWNSSKKTFKIERINGSSSKSK